MTLPAPTPGELMHSTRLLPALGFVLTGLLGRALIDKALALRGGAEMVAHWAQLSSLADIVAGVTLAGIGIGLTGSVAGMAPSRQRRLLGEALRMGLLLSGICLVIMLILAVTKLLPALPVARMSLLLPALLVGWLGIAPGLWLAWLLGCGQVLRAVVAVAAIFTLPLMVLWFAPSGSELAALLGAQGMVGAVVMLWLLPGGAAWREVLSPEHPLRSFIVAGIAIGILSPAATALARAEMAAAASWELAGAVQALWRSTEWVTAIAAGLLNAHYLPRLAAARDGPAFVLELRASARRVVAPSLAALAMLWLLLPQALALLYRADLPVTRIDALPFFAGDALRMISWIFLFGLFARGAGRAVTVGEFLSLPLFALLLCLLPGPASLVDIGLCWLLSYAAYLAFNGWAMQRSMPGLAGRPAPGAPS